MIFDDETSVIVTLLCALVAFLVLLCFAVSSSCCFKDLLSGEEEQRPRTMEAVETAQATHRPSRQESSTSSPLSPLHQLRMIEAEVKKAERRRRKSREFQSWLLQSFEENKVQMVIGAKNLKPDIEFNGCSTNGDVEEGICHYHENSSICSTRGVVELPRNLRRSMQSKMVRNECAICLESYKEGQIIVWSPNKRCQHCFHKHCIAQYLFQLYRRSTRNREKLQCSCPCCRQPFCKIPSTETK